LKALREGTRGFSSENISGCEEGVFSRLQG
jgi:hypothetical protein